VRKLLPLLVAIAAFFAAAVLWIGNDRSAGEHAFDTFSIENTSDSGLSLAFAYLRRSGHRVVRLDAPLRPGLVARNGVVIRAGEMISAQFRDEDEDEDQPRKTKLKRYSPVLTATEDEWVRGGGRLVLATAESFGPLHFSTFMTKTKQASKVFPIWPDVAALPLPEPRGIVLASLPPRAHAVFTADSHPIVTREAIGAGELILIAVPEVLQNANLRSRNALAFLSALAGSNRTVYFDESIHGFEQDDGAVAILKEWGFGPFLLIVAIGALLLYWRNVKRVGPAEDDYRETRSDAVDLVHSLGALYKSSMTDEEALGMYRDALVRTVAAQTGLRGDALYRRVNQLAAPASSGKGDPWFRTQLNALNEAFRNIAGGSHAKHR